MEGEEKLGGLFLFYTEGVFWRSSNVTEVVAFSTCACGGKGNGAEM
jgi:hypothetical protein